MPLNQVNKQQHFSTAVLDWFNQNGRKHLPWQQDPSPYLVWVSEIMLQQTQVATVIPYYERFIRRFTDVSVLAQASQDEVLHYWTGLGYYARARNLHKTAKIIDEQYQGQFPETVEALGELPGIGRSTAGAIVALAFNKRAVILDGNVKRVLCRYHCIEGWPDQSQTQKQLWQIAEQYTPEKDFRSYTQAMMDLGATVCTRSSPRCSECPLQDSCEAFLSSRCDQFPQRKPRKILPLKSTRMLILLSPDKSRVLLEKRPPQGIWGGLWSFPELQEELQVQDYLDQYGFKAAGNTLAMGEILHTFSHFQLNIRPLVKKLRQEPSSIMEKPDWHWYDLQKPQQLGLAAPIKTLLAQVEEQL